MDTINAHVETHSLKEGIEKLKNYSKQLEELYKEGENRIDRLSDSHKDQNFKKYEEEFSKFWPTLLGFMEKNNNYIAKLQEKIKFIEEEYQKIKPE
jgi:uncharacterized protein YukE